MKNFEKYFLPREIWIYIFYFLKDNKGLYPIRRTCKLFREYINSFWIQNIPYFEKNNYFVDNKLKLPRYLRISGRNPIEIDLENKELLNNFISDLSYRNCFEIIKLLFNEKTNLELIDSDGKTAFLISVELSNGLDLMKILINNGCNINAKCGKNNNNALINVCKYSNIKNFEYLLELGLDLNYKNNLGQSIIHFISSIELMKIVLNYNININISDNNNETALDYSCNYQNFDMVKFLIKNGANKIKKENVKFFILEKACLKGEIEMIKFFIKIINDKEKFFQNAQYSLIYASENGHLELVQLLIEYGIDVNIKNTNLETALFAALKNNFYKIVEILLINNAEINICHLNLETPLILSYRLGYYKISKLLIKKGANIFQNNIKNNSIITLLCKKDDPKFFNFLIKNKYINLLNGTNEYNYIITEINHFKPKKIIYLLSFLNLIII